MHQYTLINGDNLFISKGPRLLADGLAVYDLLFSGKDTFACGEMHVIHPDSVEFGIICDEEILNRDICSNNIEFSETHNGFTLQDWVQQSPEAEGVLAAFNLSQGHCWDSNTLCIQDGTIRMRPFGQRGLACYFTDSETYRMPRGNFQIFSFDPERPEIQDLNVEEVTESGARIWGKLPARNGFAGAVLIKNGEPQLDRYVFDRFCFKSTASGLPDQSVGMAMTVYGYSAGGKIIILQLAGNPCPGDSGRREPNREDMLNVLLCLGINNAILGGTSADVQRYHKNGSPAVLYAEAPPDSFFQKITGMPTGQRRLGQCLQIKVKK